MANELEITMQLKYAKDDVAVDTGRISFKVDVSGGKVLTAVQEIGTSQEAITLGDVSEGGWFAIQNLDAANFVDISGDGATDDVALVRLKAGEAAMFRMSADVGAGKFTAAADTAAVDVRYWVFDD